MRATRLAAAMSLVAALLAPRRRARRGPDLRAGDGDPGIRRGHHGGAANPLLSGVARVEAYVRSTDDSATFLAQISNPGEGAQTLRYTNATPPGSLMPNTIVELGFRITSRTARSSTDPGPSGTRTIDPAGGRSRATSFGSTGTRATSSSGGGHS